MMQYILGAVETATIHHEKVELFGQEIIHERGIDCRKFSYYCNLHPETEHSQASTLPRKKLLEWTKESKSGGYRTISATTPYSSYDSDGTHKPNIAIYTEELGPCIAILMCLYNGWGCPQKAALMHEDYSLPVGRIEDMYERSFAENTDPYAKIVISLIGGNVARDASLERSQMHRNAIAELMTRDSRVRVGYLLDCFGELESPTDVSYSMNDDRLSIKYEGNYLHISHLFGGPACNTLNHPYYRRLIDIQNCIPGHPLTHYEKVEVFAIELAHEKTERKKRDCRLYGMYCDQHPFDASIQPQRIEQKIIRKWMKKSKSGGYRIISAIYPDGLHNTHKQIYTNGLGSCIGVLMVAYNDTHQPQKAALMHSDYYLIENQIETMYRRSFAKEINQYTKIIISLIGGNGGLDLSTKRSLSHRRAIARLNKRNPKIQAGHLLDCFDELPFHTDISYAMNSDTLSIMYRGNSLNIGHFSGIKKYHNDKHPYLRRLIEHESCAIDSGNSG